MANSYLLSLCTKSCTLVLCNACKLSSGSQGKQMPADSLGRLSVPTSKSSESRLWQKTLAVLFQGFRGGRQQSYAQPHSKVQVKNLRYDCGWIGLVSKVRYRAVNSYLPVP